MKAKKIVSGITVFVVIVGLVLSFAACDNKETESNKNTGITVHGVMIDPQGVAPVGYEVVFCTQDDELYVGEVDETGAFTVSGMLPDVEHSLTVEDKNYNRYTETSFFTMVTGDEISLVNNGKNMYSYLSVNVTEAVKDIYVTFCLNTETGYVDCKYISAEGPQAPEDYTAASSSRQTTENGSVLF